MAFTSAQYRALDQYNDLLKKAYRGEDVDEKELRVCIKTLKLGNEAEYLLEQAIKNKGKSPAPTISSKTFEKLQRAGSHASFIGSLDSIDFHSTETIKYEAPEPKGPDIQRRGAIRRRLVAAEMQPPQGKHIHPSMGLKQQMAARKEPSPALVPGKPVGEKSKGYTKSAAQIARSVVGFGEGGQGDFGIRPESVDAYRNNRATNTSNQVSGMSGSKPTQSSSELPYHGYCIIDTDELTTHRKAQILPGRPSPVPRYSKGKPISQQTTKDKINAYRQAGRFREQPTPIPEGEQWFNIDLGLAGGAQGQRKLSQGRGAESFLTRAVDGVVGSVRDWGRRRRK